MEGESQEPDLEIRDIPEAAPEGRWGGREGESALRIGELSRTTGVPVPTIKFYVREGLLPAGELTSPNQARYGDAHLRRLRLIRALLEVGGLSLGSIRKVLEVVEDTGRPVHEMLGTTARTLDHLYPDAVEDPHGEARRMVADLIERRGWHISPEHPAAVETAAAVASFTAVGHEDYLESLDDFAAASERIAEADLGYVARRVEREDLVERVVVGTVLGDALLAALRRMAQVDASARRYDNA
ncbi:MerR family transcriptional regulator [Streptomyces sp. NPDC006879]|uniref:MerR family transcriptional regulator n=1 Tax=Streptomyces sp. NPDC006879 TaxID=3364767 RepID=UPI00369CA989